MPPWSIEELRICRKYVFPTVPEELLITLYDRAGGLPRYVLQRPAYLIAHLIRGRGLPTSEEQTHIIRKALERVDETIAQITNFAELMRCLYENASYISQNFSPLLYQLKQLTMIFAMIDLTF